MEKEDGRFYSEMFKRRQTGDYEDLVEFKKQDVEICLQKSESFIKRIEELTLRIIKEEKE